MLRDIQLNSDRLFTRRLNLSDVSTLFSYYSDVEAMKFRGSAPLKTMDEAEMMVRNSFNKTEDAYNLRLGICCKENNLLLGTLLLKWSPDSNTQCEIGFSFGQKFWNQGFGHETIQMALYNLQKQTSVKSVLAWCIKDNLASIKILIKNGFVESNQDHFPESILLIKELSY